jgi:hypothetical protein
MSTLPSLTFAATEGLTLTGAVKSTYLRGEKVYDRNTGFKGVEADFAGQLLS